MSDTNEIVNGLILVGDDNPSFRAAFMRMLELRGYRAAAAGTPEEVIRSIREKSFDLLVLDLDWEGEGEAGIGILRKVQRLDPLLPVLMLTGQATIPTAVEATRLGAFDYLEKILDREKTLLTIKNAIKSGRLQRENQTYVSEIRKRYELIGESAAMMQIKEKIRKTAPTDSVVLIMGESGTGKELVARQIHYQSRRNDKKFVCVDSGTLADTLAENELFGHRRGAFTGASEDRPGLIEEAEGGTLFLDEISNASPALQAKLLHVIQEREFRRLGENEMRRCNIRIIAATNQDLPALVAEGKFRHDLHFRLKVIEIAIPPLRERKEDIPSLVGHFAAAKSCRIGGRLRYFSPEATNLLLDHDWPGNVRELENAIERIIVLSDADEIGPDEVKSLLGTIWLEKDSSMKSLGDMTREFKRECIIKAINLAEGRIARAAEILQIDRTHLYRLINEYQLNGDE